MQPVCSMRVPVRRAICGVTGAAKLQLISVKQKLHHVEEVPGITHREQTARLIPDHKGLLEREAHTGR